jgi:hypothetical protein
LGAEKRAASSKVCPFLAEDGESHGDLGKCGIHIYL